MKTIIALFSLLLIVATAPAATITLAWDPSPAAEEVTKYTVYQKTGTTWTKVMDVTTPTATLLNVTPGSYTYAVTASNVWLEGPQSNQVTTPLPATAPKNVKVITVTVTVN